MKLLDAECNELFVGDDVVFSSQSWVYRGYIYKIQSGKVYMTTKPRNERPSPDAHKVPMCSVFDKPGGTIIGRRHESIIKIK